MAVMMIFDGKFFHLFARGAFFNEAAKVDCAEDKEHNGKDKEKRGGNSRNSAGCEAFGKPLIEISFEEAKYCGTACNHHKHHG